MNNNFSRKRCAEKFKRPIFQLNQDITRIPMYTLCLFLFIALPSETSSFIGKQDTSRITHLVEIAKQKQKERLPDSAEYYFKQAGELADQLNAESGKLLFAGN